MRAEYDFSKGKRGRIAPSVGKTRVTIYLDDAIIEAFRARAEEVGSGYQTMINEALKVSLKEGSQPVTESVLRRVIREELPSLPTAKARRAGSRKSRRTAA